MHTCLLVGWIAASLGLWLPAAVAHADKPAASPQVGPHTRVVLLKNDRCLTGLVRELGDHVLIEIDETASVSKAVSDIQCIADDLEGIYRHKLARYAHMGSGENIRMARWCLAVGLNEHAAAHFLALNKDKDARETSVVKQVGVELREQLLADEAFRIYLGLDPLKKTPQNPHIQTVAAGPVANLTPVVPAVVTSFTDQVQPILLNRCSQSGCHGISATNKFKIIQPVGSARGRISEQNCRSALRFVSVDDSNMSVLLRYALTAHGVQKSAGIASQEPRHIETLQSWTTFARNPVVAAVETNAVGAVPAATPAVYTERPTPPSRSDGLQPLVPGAAQLRAVPRQPKFGVQGSDSGSPSTGELDKLDDELRRILGEPPRHAPPSLTAPAPGAAAHSQAASGAARPAAAAPPALPPADPFDPAEFNRASSAKPKP